MNRRAALVFVLSAFAVAVSGAVFFLVWQSLNRDRIERDVVQTRARVERFIGLERWDEAASVLEAVAEANFPDERLWIPFIQQARTVESEHDDVEALASRIAEGSLAALPDSGRLRAVYTLLLLDEGRDEEAGYQAEFLPEGEFASIGAELWLRGQVDHGPEGDSSSAHVVRSIETGDAPSLKAAWESTGAVAFGHNAVLKALSIGDRVEAGNMLMELPRSERVAPLGFLFAVEEALAGSNTAIDEANRWLELIPPAIQGDPSVLLARADLAALEDELSQRRLLLADALAAAPQYSAVPYLALSRLSPNPAEATGWLTQGLRARETDTEIAVNLAAVLRDAGDHEASIDVLSRTKEARDGRDDERLAFAWVLFNPDFSAERRRTALWQLLERFPESETLAAELTSRTARAGDVGGLRILRSHKGVQLSDWLRGLEAAIAVSRGDTSDAVAAYEGSDPQGWSERYNYALALLSDRRYGSAFNAFETALDRAKAEGAASGDVASIYLRAAETALLRRNRAQAREYAGRALEYQPSMVRARMLWRITGDWD